MAGTKRSILDWLGRQKVRAGLVAAGLALTIALTPPDAERYGDRLQIALPVMALGCSALNGQAGEFLLRYFVMFFTVHGTKRALAEESINIRPHGGGHGFPSAHTSTAVLGASSLVHDCVTGSPFVRGLIVVAAGYTGASRIEAGAHDIWQVLAGALWGWACERAFRRNRRVRGAVGGFFRGLKGLIYRGVRTIYEAVTGRLNWMRHKMMTSSSARRAARAAKDSSKIVRVLAVLAALVAVPGIAKADWEISFYLGAQTAPHSGVTGSDPGGVGDFDFSAGWEGRPFQAPPYYGVRATWWRTETLGFGLEINHQKVYLDDESLAESGFSRFELSDGMNLVTANVMRRWPGQWVEGRLTPYVGAGAGVAVPHVDVESGGGKTFGYQLTGPAVVVMAGVSYAINDKWNIFTEYKGSYSMHDADLDNGGSFETDIVTNALNFGVGFNF